MKLPVGYLSPVLGTGKSIDWLLRELIGGDSWALTYYLLGELKAALQQFVDDYNHEHYHESLKNLTPADVFYGRGQEILDRREKIKLATLARRREMHYASQTKHTPR